MEEGIEQETVFQKWERDVVIGRMINKKNSEYTLNLIDGKNEPGVPNWFTGLLIVSLVFVCLSNTGSFAQTTDEETTSQEDILATDNTSQVRGVVRPAKQAVNRSHPICVLNRRVVILIY